MATVNGMNPIGLAPYPGNIDVPLVAIIITTISSNRSSGGGGGCGTGVNAIPNG